MNLTEFYSHDYIDDVMIRFTYHSTGIEGNTLTLGETTSILLYKTLPASQKTRSLREIYEVSNHRETFAYMLDSAEHDLPVNIALIKKLQYLLTKDTVYNAGEFKETSNYIKGADFETADPSQVPMLMQQWCDNLNYQLQHANSFDDKLRIILAMHIQFEQYHPFSDGNGRTGRILINYLLIKMKQPLLIIARQDRSKYISYLQNNDIDGLFNYAKQKLTQEQKRLHTFQVESKKQSDFENRSE